MKIDIDEVVQFVMQADEEYGIALAEGLNKLRTELEQERKRLDWALAHDAMYYEWEGGWDFCYTLDSGHAEVVSTENPRATIDELMGE